MSLSSPRSSAGAERMTSPQQQSQSPRNEHASDSAGEGGPASGADALLDSASYRAVLRHQAGAVTVVATGRSGARAGLTATAVCSLSDDPPTVLVCVGRGTGAHDLIASEGVFSINILARDQKDVAEIFSGRRGMKGEARFASLPWYELTTGAPLLEGALANLDCALVESHGFSTHSIFIGRVRSGMFRSDAEPLLYFRGDYWHIGER